MSYGKVCYNTDTDQLFKPGFSKQGFNKLRLHVLVPRTISLIPTLVITLLRPVRTEKGIFKHEVNKQQPIVLGHG